MLYILDVFSFETWIFLILIAVLLRFYIHQKWQALKKLNIPHDPPSILQLGNYRRYWNDLNMFFKEDSKNIKRLGKVFGTYTFLQYSITVGDPEILKHIFIKEFSTFSNRRNHFIKLSGNKLNQSLTNTSGKNWKRMRRTMTSAFSNSKLKEMMGLIETCVDQTINNLKQAVNNSNNGRFSPEEVFGRLTLDLICSTGFGINVQAQAKVGEKDSKIIKMAKMGFDKSIRKYPFNLLILLFPKLEVILEKLNYSIYSREMLNYFEELAETLFDRSIHEQRSALLQTMLKFQVSNKEIQSGIYKGLTRDEIIGNSMMLIMGGYENTTNTMLFFVYNLATHKRVQNKLYEEISNAVQKYGSLTYECVTSLNYLHMCLNESLRLYTPIAQNSRVCDKDITIKGLFIPKNTLVQIPTYALAHDEEYWDNPFKYKPERFEDMDSIDPMTFTPFGAGPRNCIAMRFAQLEVKIAICKLLTEFNLDVCDDTPFPPLQMNFTGTMKPMISFYLKVTPKNQSL